MRDFTVKTYKNTIHVHIILYINQIQENINMYLEYI